VSYTCHVAVPISSDRHNPWPQPLHPFSQPPAQRTLHSFPTRRSSDLESRFIGSSGLDEGAACRIRSRFQELRRVAGHHDLAVLRSEEHTSELQSRFDLVCRLLLEKKKKKTSARYHYHQLALDIPASE